MQYFFDVWMFTRANLTNIKSSRKEHFKWTYFKFWPMKNYQPIRVWLWLVYKFTDKKLSLACNFSSRSYKVKRDPWQNKYPNLKTTYHINPKIFLSTKLQKNLLLAKYRISVATSLTNVNWLYVSGKDSRKSQL